MNSCPFCGHKNRQGLWFCEACGRDLYDVVADETLPTQEVPHAAIKPSTQIDVGTTQFPADSSLMIYFRDAEKPLVCVVREHSIYSLRR